MFRAGNLTKYLHDISGVPIDSIVAYLSDGRPLHESGIPESTLSPQDVRSYIVISTMSRIDAGEQHIFVFNKQFLDIEIEDVLSKLSIDSRTAPQLNGINSSSLCGQSYYLFK